MKNTPRIPQHPQLEKLISKKIYWMPANGGEAKVSVQIGGLAPNSNVESQPNKLTVF